MYICNECYFFVIKITSCLNQFQGYHYHKSSLPIDVWNMWMCVFLQENAGLIL